MRDVMPRVFVRLFVLGKEHRLRRYVGFGYVGVDLRVLY